MVRIIGAEVAIAPGRHPEVELGIMPLAVDLPGPPRGRRSIVVVRLTLHTSRGDLTIRQRLDLQPEDTPDTGAGFEEAQYRALLHSVEGRRSSKSFGFRWPFVWPFGQSRSSESPDRSSEPPDGSSDPPTDPGESGFHARLPRPPLVPSDQTAAAVPSHHTVALSSDQTAAVLIDLKRRFGGTTDG